MLDANPTAALRHFQSADCGAPCVAEEGDAQTRLGNERAAVDDYLSARAGPRLALTVRRMAARGQYDAAMSLERQLIARLGGDPLYRADLAAAYESQGSVDAAAGYARPARAAAYRRAAIENFRRATELASFNEEYLLSYAFALLQWGDKRSARAAFARELVLHPHQPDAEKALQSLSAQPPGI